MIGFSLSFLVLSGASFSPTETALKAELKLTIKDVEVETLIRLESPASNISRSLLILVPFVLEETVYSFPSEAACSSDILYDHYTLFSLVVPAGETKTEVVAVSRSLLLESGDWRRIRFSFEHNNPPALVLDILGQPNTISYYESVEVVFPPDVDMDFVTVTPTPSRIMHNTYYFEMVTIHESAKGTLSIAYTVQGSSWQFLLMVGILVGISPAWALTRYRPRRESRKRFLFLVPIGVSYFTASFSVLMLLMRGIRWDFLPLYLPTAIEIAVATSAWLKGIFGKAQPTETMQQTTS